MSKRPVRETTTKLSNKIPKGPLGFLGRGNAIGAVGFFTVSAINGVVPIDGMEIGFDVETHNIDRRGNVEEHTFLVHSVSENVARFIGKYKSTPTNLNFVTDEVEVVLVEEISPRRGFSLWRVKTEVQTQGRITPEEVEV